jgi:glutamate decarboxylase
MNQNVVKSETSKTITMLEKHVTASLHRLIYNLDDAFYHSATEDPDVALGMFTSGGTIANITGLWVARNRALGPDEAGGFAGVEQRGLLEAALHYGYKGEVVIGSDLMHYSFKKATDVLGIGVQGLVTCSHDERYRVCVSEVEQKICECKARNICVLAVVGVAGATETGAVDDLDSLATVAQQHGIHFHVDAAWGGPALFSADLAPMLKGIEQADSVTIDGHKQLFMPMGCGMLLLKDPNNSNYISKTASYIIRHGSNDLGRFTLEGSRPANAVYMHANLSCIGASGYEALMNRSVRVCRYMAFALRSSGAFEVLFEPMMNILLYRFVPLHLREKLLVHNQGLTDEEWACVDSANAALQEQQKAEGHTFVSRTSVEDAKHGRRLVALRVVIGNPLTEEKDIDAVIADQLRILNEEQPASVGRNAKIVEMEEHLVPVLAQNAGGNKGIVVE